MTFIEGEIIIARPAEAVFDFAADQRNEPRYNPRMVRAEKVTGGPVGKGTVFRSAVRAAGRATEMRSELTGYHRPAWLASRTTMAQADIAGTLTFEPVPGGTRMRWAWVVRPKGASRLLTPVISRIGRRQERAIWTGMKRYLEAQPQPGRDDLWHRHRPGAAGPLGRIIALAAGSVLLLISLAFIAGGGTLAWADTEQLRSGYLTTTTTTYSTSGYALVSDPIKPYGTWGWLSLFVDRVRIRISSSDPSRPLFAGIAAAGDVERYLGDVSYTTVGARGGHDVTDHPGTGVPAAPAAALPWAAQTQGTGTLRSPGMGSAATGWWW